MTDAPTPLRELRDAARERLARLDADLAELRLDRGGASSDDEHDPEGATLSGEWSRLEGLRSAAADDLAAVDEALARADAGTYGVCVDCGRDIPSARLEARPTATRCVECESARRR